MKKIIRRIVIIVLAVLLVMAAGIWFYYTHYYDEMEKEILDAQKADSMPEQYEDKSIERGTVKVVKYETTFEGETVVKRANVYLPYGYEKHKKKKYNVVYLMHGRGGTYKSWLGKGGTRPFKNILDNMIENKDIKPLIVVTPGLAYEYGEDDDVMDGTATEITGDLMPVINKKFRTFGDRDHTGMAGFSMGGSLTWHMVKDHMDCFRYYIPMSMALYYDSNGYSDIKSIKAAAEIIHGIKISGYASDDFKIYCATGYNDHKAMAAFMQVQDLVNSDPLFEYANDDFTEGNIKFNLWPYRWHRYTQAFPYLYNGLKYFFGRN